MFGPNFGFNKCCSLFCLCFNFTLPQKNVWKTIQSWVAWEAFNMQGRLQKNCPLGKPPNKKNGKKRGHCPHVGGGQPQFPFLAQIYRNLPDPQITQKLTLDTLKIQFLSYFLSFLGHFKPLLIQGVQGVWFLVILRAFDIKMSRVASHIYALLSVIRQ